MALTTSDDLLSTGSPVSVANGGTGLSALGSALQQLRVNAAGTALEYAAASAGFTPGKANLIHAGAVTAHATLGAAADVAADGDTILGLGVFNENDLWRSGVELHYEFPTGCGVAYTGGGTANCGIFDNGANGSNSDVVGTIGGSGSFSYLAGDSGPACGVLNVAGHDAQVKMRAASITSDRCCVKLIDTVQTSKVHVQAQTIQNASATFGAVMLTSGALLRVEAGVIESTGGTPAIDMSSESAASKIVIHAGRVAATNAYSAVLLDENEDLLLVVDGDITGTGCPAVAFQGSATGRASILARRIESSGTSYTISCTGTGTYTVDCPLITEFSDTGYPVRTYGTGTLRLINARVVNTATGQYGGGAATLGGGGRFETYGSCAFIAGASATDSITAAADQDIINFGTISGNKALNLSGTGAVRVSPAANVVFGSSYVA